MMMLMMMITASRYGHTVDALRDVKIAMQCSTKKI